MSRILNILSIETFLIALFLAIGSSLAIALATDTEQSLHIVADTYLFDYKTGIHTYEGNVKVDQGSSHLTADRAVTKSNSQNKMEEAIAYGVKHLAEYSTIPKEGDQLFRAKAKVIKYYPSKAEIVLEGDVIVTQGKNSFNGPVIIYNIKDQTVAAPASKSGRGTIVIESNQIQT